MNQYLFEDWLRNRLDDLPPEELDRIVAFYLDAIAERMEEGMTEEEAIHDLGEPESLLAGIRASLPEYVTYTPSRQIRQKTSSFRKWVMASLIVAALGVALPVLLLVVNLGSNTRMEYVETPAEYLPPMAESVPIVESIHDSNILFDASTLEKVTVAAALSGIQAEPSPDGAVHIIGDPAFYQAVRRGNTLYVENVESELILQIPDHLKLDIKCDAGDVVLYEIAPQSLNVYCDLGNITLYGVSAVRAITLEADLGNIEGSLRGAETDYKIDVETDLGQCNLTDSVNDGTPLTITADLGNVYLEFEE